MSWTILSRGLLCSLLLLTACATPSTPPPKSAPERAAPPADRGKELGKQFLLEARKQYRFVKDQEVVDAVNHVGRRIVTAAGGNPDAFHFLVVKEIQPNAFAIPGGYIFVFDGLLARLNSEDELAGVLAHETGHVMHNHFFKQDNKTLALDLATIAAILLSRGQAAAANIAVAADIAAQLQFSRENEQEADASAIQYIKQAGYDPHGLFNFLQGLQGYESINGVDMPAYLSTHPALQDRIHLVELRLDRPIERVFDTIPKPMDWGRIEITIRAESKAWQDVATLFPERPPGSPPDERYHYLAGLAYLAADQTAQAIAEFQAALRSSPSNPVYHADLASAYLKSRDVERARNEANESLKDSKLGEEPAAAYLVLGMVEEHAGQFEKAIQHYAEVIRRNPDHVFAHYHIGQAYFQTGHEAEGAYHTGRYLRLNLEPEAALREFKRAKEQAAKNTDLVQKIQEQIDQIISDGI